MLKLIVHADDFGLTKQTNEGIILAHRDGIVTSASIMANGSAFEEAVGLIRTVPALDIGVHLTLVGERPVLPCGQIPSLVDREGKMHVHAKQFIKRYLAGKIDLKEVRRELEAQIKKVFNHGIRASHLDSHQHLHMLPGIFPIVTGLADKFNIPAIRFPRERFRLGMLREGHALGRILPLMALNVLCFWGRVKGTVPSLSPSLHFSGFLYSGNLNKHNIRKVLRSLPLEGVCELMCHPGLDDPDGPYRHWGHHPAEELSALTDPGISGLLARRNIGLISYRQFAHDPDGLAGLDARKEILK